MERIRVVQMGLGPIGNKVTQYLAERTGVVIVGAIDVDPAKEGQDIGVLAGLAPLGVTVTRDLDALLSQRQADIIVLTTASGLIKVYDQIMTLLKYGVNVVSTCEELSYPWRTNPDLARKIDLAAREKGVSVLATGINPGFLMDCLPLVVSGICRNVQRITVERIQDATFRRIPFQRKIGAGLTRAEFDRKVKEGVLRHVGLMESLHMIAAKMGWTLDKTEEEISPVLADRTMTTERLTIEEGCALGVQQIGRGIKNGSEVITLMFRAAIGEENVKDRVFIQGTPDLEFSFRGGVNGDIGTCAIIVNSLPVVMAARPGLRTMADIEPISCWR